MSTLFAALEEIVITLQGGDWGYSALGDLIGDGAALALLNWIA